MIKYLFLILLLSSTVIGQGIGGEPYTFTQIPECTGQITVKVYPQKQSDYSIVGCTRRDANTWICACRNRLQILTPRDNINTFLIKGQYNTHIPKPEMVNGEYNHNNIVYNSGIKRLFEVKVNIGEDPKLIEEREQKRLQLLGERDNILKFILITIFSAIFFPIILLIIFLVTRPKLRKWLELEEEESMSVKKIITKLFKREDIDRKSLESLRFKSKEKTIEEELEQEVNTILYNQK